MASLRILSRDIPEDIGDYNAAVDRQWRDYTANLERRAEIAEYRALTLELAIERAHKQRDRAQERLEKQRAISPSRWRGWMLLACVAVMLAAVIAVAWRG